MNTQQEVVCPADFITVNENKVRLVALLVFLISLLILWNPHWLLITLLMIDFSLRSFDLNKFSPLAIVASGIMKVVPIGIKPIDQAPKRFAARIGLLFSISILIVAVTGYETAALALTSVLIVFSFLESFLSFCAGCHVYTYSKKFFKT